MIDIKLIINIDNTNKTLENKKEILYFYKDIKKKKRYKQLNKSRKLSTKKYKQILYG